MNYEIKTIQEVEADGRVLIVWDYTCTVYLEYQSVRPFVQIGSPPHPFSRKRVCSHHLEPKGGGNTRLRVRGREEPIRTTGEKAWHSVYFVVLMVAGSYKNGTVSYQLTDGGRAGRKVFLGMLLLNMNMCDRGGALYSVKPQSNNVCILRK